MNYKRASFAPRGSRIAIVAARRMTRPLGVEGKEELVCAFGTRDRSAAKALPVLDIGWPGARSA